MESWKIFTRVKRHDTQQFVQIDPILINAHIQFQKFQPSILTMVASRRQVYKSFFSSFCLTVVLIFFYYTWRFLE